MRARLPDHSSELREEISCSFAPSILDSFQNKGFLSFSLSLPLPPPPLPSLLSCPHIDFIPFSHILISFLLFFVGSHCSFHWKALRARQRDTSSTPSALLALSVLHSVLTLSSPLLLFSLFLYLICLSLPSYTLIRYLCTLFPSSSAPCSLRR